MLKYLVWVALSVLLALMLRSPLSATPGCAEFTAFGRPYKGLPPSLAEEIAMIARGTSAEANAADNAPRLRVSEKRNS